jgi:hypothetical protein
MSAGSLLEILELYFEAFAETHVARRAELLARCIADEGEIWGPNLRFSGREEISGKIAAFHRNWPACRLVLAQGPVTFAGFARFGNAIVGDDGTVKATGETIVELASDGRITTVVPFWDATLPPVPGSWPRHLGVPPLQNDRVAGSQPPAP